MAILGLTGIKVPDMENYSSAAELLYPEKSWGLEINRRGGTLLAVGVHGLEVERKWVC